jgi:citrate lyase subunit beta/citryl-CoA lyase
MIRSWLFVPGDSASKLDKGLGSGADALIIDLEDSVAESAKPAARTAVGAFLKRPARPRRPRLWVRINPLATAHALADLEAVAPAAPDGIVLPKPNSVEETLQLGRHLSDLEARHGVARDSIGILPIATETPAALFNMGTYAKGAPRLAALTWGAEDLPTALGAITNRLDNGDYTDACRIARTLCLAAAAAAGLPAIETVYPAFRDLDGLRAYAAQGRREGFTGMMAIHPAQVPVINAVFTPSDAECHDAQRIVDAFAANPTAGVVAIDGKMVDAPHLTRARRVLALAAASRGTA